MSKVSMKKLRATKNESVYVCRHCGLYMRRRLSNKKWVKSFCRRVGKSVHLVLIETASHLKEKKS